MTPAAQQIADLAAGHVGEAYVLGARANYADPEYRGPWDCAELATWAVRQVTGRTWGISPTGDAYSGAWAALVTQPLVPLSPGRYTIAVGLPLGIPPEIGAATPGAVLVRAPSAPGLSGHVAIVRSADGRTVEAYDHAHGVIGASAVGRRWTSAILVPGVEYFVRTPIALIAPAVLRLGDHGPEVEALQAALNAAGFDAGKVDGWFGPRTLTAVLAVQRAAHLVPDGEAGPLTRAAIRASRASRA